jgi:hypothetical protein
VTFSILPSNRNGARTASAVARHRNHPVGRDCLRPTRSVLRSFHRLLHPEAGRATEAQMIRTDADIALASRAYHLGGLSDSDRLLRRTIRDHLRRSRPEIILNLFQRIRLRFSRACGLNLATPSPRHAKSELLLSCVLGNQVIEMTWEPSHALVRERKASLAMLSVGKMKSAPMRSTTPTRSRLSRTPC